MPTPDLPNPPGSDPLPASATRTTETIELLEELLRVSKREVETGRVRVSLVTDTEQHVIEDQVATRRVDVERIPVGRHLAPGEAVPQSRTEGDLLIVPVIEEVLVVEKRLVVTEELRIRIVQGHEPVSHTIPLRRQRAIVERLEPDAA